MTVVVCLTGISVACYVLQIESKLYKCLMRIPRKYVLTLKPLSPVWRVSIIRREKFVLQQMVSTRRNYNNNISNNIRFHKSSTTILFIVVISSAILAEVKRDRFSVYVLHWINQWHPYAPLTYHVLAYLWSQNCFAVVGLLSIVFKNCAAVRGQVEKQVPPPPFPYAL